MSLKIFHLCFITLSTFLAIGCAVWAFAGANTGFGAACVALAVAMPIYGVAFWKKARRIIL
jgi:hypothetical protein